MAEGAATDNFSIIDGGVSIDYPQFSPGADSPLPTKSLPEPLLSLPSASSERSNQSKSFSSNLFDEHIPRPSVVSPGVKEATNKSMSIETLTLRLQHMDNVSQDLQREKKVMEDQFGQQRRKFMNLMVQKDEELSHTKRSIEQLSAELNHLRQQLRARDEEVQTILKDTKARELAMRESFDIDRLKYEEEIRKCRRQGSETRQLADFHRSPSPGDSNLEGDKAKAEEEARVLKAVVLPLEEEIDSLKLQLSEANEKLQNIQHTDTSLLIDLESPTAPDQLWKEHSSISGPDAYISTLELEKSALQKEIVQLKNSVVELKTELSGKEESYQQLQETWDKANQHFIVAQNKLYQKMYFMEQKHQLLKSGDIHVTERTPDTPLTSLQKISSRSYSCDSVREDDQKTQLHVRAAENELKRVKQKLEQQKTTRESYEAQLQRVQEQMLEELAEKDQELIRLREDYSKARAGVVRERKSKEELRRKVEESSEKFKAQVESFQNGLETEQSKLKSIKEQYTQSKHEAQRDLARFSDERISLFGQLSSAQEEYDCLKVIQADETQKVREQIKSLTKERTMAEDNAVALQLRLSDVERERQLLEEGLRRQIAALQNQLAIEGEKKEKQEIELKRQLEEAMNHIATLEQVKTELGQGQQMAVEARTDVEEKSRNFIAEQHQKLEAEVAARKTAEQMVRELQRQISSLRSQLNTSQENQKDFVELSQTLQMKLAQIEEEQKNTSYPS